MEEALEEFLGELGLLKGLELGVEACDVFKETCVDTVVVFTDDPGNDIEVKLAVTLLED